jgi:hypothetical protein
MLCMWGCEQWDKAQWMQWLHTPAFTEAGFQNRRKVFERLVARGVIVAEDSSE